MFFRLFVLAIACVLSAGTFAACNSKTTATACAPAAYEVADAELQATYQTLLNRLQNQTVLRRRLINSQRAWHAFRDAECEYVTAHGSTHTESYERCAQTLSEQRSRALKHYQQCEESSSECAVALP